jgi:hypothetical protein
MALSTKLECLPLADTADFDLFSLKPKQGVLDYITRATKLECLTPPDTAD